MDHLNATICEALGSLQETELRREQTIGLSREIIRETKRVIHAIHSYRNDVSVSDLEILVSKLKGLTADDPCMSGPAEDAFAEYCEAVIFFHIATGADIPSYKELNVSPRPWVLGLADCIGELRRMLLNSVMSGNIRKAEELFSVMEGIYNNIMLFDSPESVLPIRRKQDIARSLMEKTRADLTNAVVFSNRKD